MTDYKHTIDFDRQSICVSFKDGLISFPTYTGAKAGELIDVAELGFEDEIIIFNAGFSGVMLRGCGLSNGIKEEKKK